MEHLSDTNVRKNLHNGTHNGTPLTNGGKANWKISPAYGIDLPKSILWTNPLSEWSSIQSAVSLTNNREPQTDGKKRLPQFGPFDFQAHSFCWDPTVQKWTVAAFLKKNLSQSGGDRIRIRHFYLHSARGKESNEWNKQTMHLLFTCTAKWIRNFTISGQTFLWVLC